MEPVVIAFTRGIVIVGELACAVKGIAAPERIRLSRGNKPICFGSEAGLSSLPLCECKGRLLRVDEVAVNSPLAW